MKRGGDHRAEARARQHAAYRALAEAEGNLDLHATASAIIAKVRQYKRLRWRRDRQDRKTDSADAFLFEILNTELPILGPGQVYKLLKSM